MDASARGADFSWPRTGTSGGHQCGLFMAISADFLVATDSLPDVMQRRAPNDGSFDVMHVWGVRWRAKSLASTIAQTVEVAVPGRDPGPTLEVGAVQKGDSALQDADGDLLDDVACRVGIGSEPTEIRLESS